MTQREHWRGIMEWSFEGLALSTPSNQSCKMYDAALSQVVGFYDDPLLGGIGGTFDSMFLADPDFVLGHCLKIDLMLAALASTTTKTELTTSIDNLIKLSKSDKPLTDREKAHVDATLRLARGDLDGACQIWEKILLTYPTDLHALKTCYDIYFNRGQFRQLRDTVARVLPFWQSSDIPLKGYLHGLLAFGFCETNIFDKAEAQARRALEWNPCDGWASHSLAHVFEMTVRVDEGIKFLQTTEDDWKKCNILARHNYWHKAVFHIENNSYDEAISILDNILIPQIDTTPHGLDLADAISLLTRLGFTCPQEKDFTAHWKSTYKASSPYLGTRISSFQDAHYLLACIESGNDSVGESILTSLQEQDYFFTIDKKIVKSLLEAIIAYKREKYSEAVELLLPIKYDISKIGGSEAQRDLFSQLLIIAAIKSKCEQHRKLAEHLLIERENLRSNSKLTAGLLQQLNRIK
ncbi:tetratricopeptide repeat protein 38 [Tetranychus urticae]|uniref:Tetratricopeptide repeat protein 38 n=1 Tax=Tetranychus urticae TaxID=32264 RepID=T1JS69_TETUR|nr:tetratricopeptide repeat protein 38 [Tetranychus urticae]